MPQDTSEVTRSMTIIVGGFDGGGWGLVPDAQGNYKFSRIQGFDRDQLNDVNSALNILREAAQLKETGIGRRIAAEAVNIAKEELGRYISGLDLGERRGQQVVVVLTGAMAGTRAGTTGSGGRS